MQQLQIPPIAEQCRQTAPRACVVMKRETLQTLVNHSNWWIDSDDPDDEERLILEAVAEAEEILKGTCERCGGEMAPGQAIEQTYTSGAPDFPGDSEGVTMSAGGSGKIIECMKCKRCGHSVRMP